VKPFPFKYLSECRESKKWQKWTEWQSFIKEN
jgi:hypothetical protein